jgi:hypothetical protein
MTHVCAVERRHCSAIVNIEDQPHKFHWVGAGEVCNYTRSIVLCMCMYVYVYIPASRY